MLIRGENSFFFFLEIRRARQAWNYFSALFSLHWQSYHVRENRKREIHLLKTLKQYRTYKFIILTAFLRKKSIHKQAKHIAHIMFIHYYYITMQSIRGRKVCLLSNSQAKDFTINSTQRICRSRLSTKCNIFLDLFPKNCGNALETGEKCLHSDIQKIDSILSASAVKVCRSLAGGRRWPICKCLLSTFILGQRINPHFLSRNVREHSEIVWVRLWQE